MFLNSTQKLYEKIAQGEIDGFTVPAFNIRTLTFEVARALFRAAKKEKAGAFIVELAQSEMDYTCQSPEEYAKNILRAARAEKFNNPIFLQADHFKPNQKKPENLEKLIPRVIKAGFYNIDIDGSSLPLRENFTQTAKFTAFIRKLEPKNTEISIGGEVGVIGGENTTMEDFREFLEGYTKELSKYSIQKGLIKVAIQTGTSHGGVVLPSGELKKIEADFDTLRELSQEAKKYGLAGVVQHGASTLPERYFERFPVVGTLEIHLATIFQNIIYDSDYFPQSLKDKIYFWLKEKFSEKKDPADTQEQFFYKFRKYALGIFKEEILKIPQKNVNKICEEIEEKFIFFFRKLKVRNTVDLIKEIYF